MSAVVSVVIPAYGRTELLLRCVRSLALQTLAPDRFEVFVVDSSPDGANEQAVAALAATVPFPLTCLRKSPEGPGPSRNMGARQNDSPFIAFLDSDCVASPRWLAEGLGTFQEGVGIVQGRVLADPETPTGVFTHYIVIESESHFYETANIFYRREAFQQCGGFPADLAPRADRPFGGEDTVAAWTAKRMGWKTAFAREALVYHEVRPITVKQWICIRPLFMVPLLVRRFPELRRFMFGGYFYDRAQGLLLLALAGAAGAFWQPWLAALAIPYVLHRGMGPSKTLTGPLRLLRVGAYFLRDTASLGYLLGGSVRFRALLL
ncbi:MAG: glycosyltransferase [Bryobacterales bacterium]|nr:glycosyltransferase [Bryobacterales bacterium]